MDMDELQHKYMYIQLNTTCISSKLCVRMRCYKQSTASLRSHQTENAFATAYRIGGETRVMGTQQIRKRYGAWSGN